MILGLVGYQFEPRNMTIKNVVGKIEPRFIGKCNIFSFSHHVAARIRISNVENI
jgi:hypothetical protein